MPEMNDIIKLAIDAYHGNVEKYSVRQSQEALRQALIEANGGSTIINYRAVRDGKCAGVFALVEKLIPRLVVEGLQGDEFFNSMVEFHNVAEGDKPVFVIEDSTLFVVAKVANGTQGIRRQRIAGAEEVEVKTSMHMVRIYEELNRVLAGRVDFNAMIAKVSESFRVAMLEEVYALWASANAQALGSDYYVSVSGTYDEDKMLDLVAHVEAASGKTATIIGTKKAIRNLAPSIQGIDSQSDLYNMGYYGKFYGTPVVCQPQRHKIGSTQFALDDDIITVIASGEKPIKFVYEGDALIIPGNPMDNADLTQELEYTA